MTTPAQKLGLKNEDKVTINEQELSEHDWSDLWFTPDTKTEFVLAYDDGTECVKFRFEAGAESRSYWFDLENVIPVVQNKTNTVEAPTTDVSKNPFDFEMVLTTSSFRISVNKPLDASQVGRILSIINE